MGYAGSIIRNAYLGRSYGKGGCIGSDNHIAGYAKVTRSAPDSTIHAGYHRDGYVLNLAEELERRTGLKPALVAEGRWTAVATFACAAAPAAFADMRLVNPPKTYLESLKARAYLSFADICPAGL